MRCKGMKPKKNAKGYTRTKNCGRPAKFFFRVTYSDLYPHEVEGGVYEDVIGFCADCAKDKNTPKGYRNNGYSERTILRLRGVVGRVEPCEGDASELAVESKANVHKNYAKGQILRIMKTKGNECLSEDWPEIFQNAWDQFQLESVMKK